MEGRSTQRIALFIAILAGFLAPFDISAVNIALPSIGAEFSLDALSLTWVSTAYLLSSALFLVPFGRIADIVGRKRIFTLGLSLFAGASFFMAFTFMPATIIPLRVIQGMGGALIYGTSVAILTAVTPLEDRGKALGIYTTSVYLGLSLGPFLGGVMTGQFGWRSIFLVNVPIGLITLGLIRWRLHGEWADARGERFDSPGAVFFGLSLIAVMLGFTWLPGGSACSWSSWASSSSPGLCAGRSRQTIRSWTSDSSQGTGSSPSPTSRPSSTTAPPSP